MYSFTFNGRKSVDKYAVLYQEKHQDMKLDYAQYFKTAEEAIKYVINVETSTSYNGHLTVSVFPNILIVLIGDNFQYVVTGLSEEKIKMALSMLDKFEKSRQEQLKNRFNPENVLKYKNM